jgi:hypothetical protein
MVRERKGTGMGEMNRVTIVMGGVDDGKRLVVKPRRKQKRQFEPMKGMAWEKSNSSSPT